MSRQATRPQARNIHVLDLVVEGSHHCAKDGLASGNVKGAYQHQADGQPRGGQSALTDRARKKARSAVCSRGESGCWVSAGKRPSSLSNGCFCKLKLTERIQPKSKVVELNLAFGRLKQAGMEGSVCGGLGGAHIGKQRCCLSVLAAEQR